MIRAVASAAPPVMRSNGSGRRTGAAGSPCACVEASSATVSSNRCVQVVGARPLDDETAVPASDETEHGGRSDELARPRAIELKGDRADARVGGRDLDHGGRRVRERPARGVGHPEADRVRARPERRDLEPHPRRVEHLLADESGGRRRARRSRRRRRGHSEARRRARRRRRAPASTRMLRRNRGADPGVVSPRSIARVRAGPILT